ncbi:MAG: hypothetical protein HY898_34455 [Deltaproteobacteria bacterium]|nr:hypothetical protein [Deltaproteobacteria bacterium]
MTDPPPDPRSKDVPFSFVFGGVFLSAVVILVAWVVWKPRSAPADPPPPKVEQIDPPDLIASKPAPTRWAAQGPVQVVHDEEAPVPREIPRVPTPQSEVDVARLLIQAHEVVFGSPPNDQRLSVAWAQIALEHGRGRDIECNNFGNIIMPDNGAGDFYVLKATERTRKNAKARLEKWEQVNMKFRAYRTPLDGAVAYWKLIKDQYTDALAYFDQGNGFLAGRRLAEAGYMTAEAQPYASGMGSLQQEFFVRVQPSLH